MDLASGLLLQNETHSSVVEIGLLQAEKNIVPIANNEKIILFIRIMAVHSTNLFVYLLSQQCSHLDLVHKP